MEDRVIHDSMDVLGRPQGSYPESFVSLSFFLLRYVRFRVEEERRRSRVGFSDFKAQPALAKAVAEAGLSNYLCTM